MGRPIAVNFDDPRSREKTRATVDSIASPDDDPNPFESEDIFGDEESDESDSLRKTAEHRSLKPGELEETSESVFNNTTKAPWDDEPTKRAVPRDIPRQKVRPTAKDAKKTRPNLTKTASSKSTSSKSPGSKPKLSDLLKKVREKKAHSGGSLLKPPPSSATDSSSTSDFMDGLDTIIKESAEEMAVPEPSSAHDDNEASAGMPLQAALAAGLASERKGSGYIRIPTAEILDVIGRGDYRLRVDDVVYEPVDEKGLARLIKGGVLMGAELIAEQDGDWMPVADHPVVKRLRQKMALEAHRLLSEVASATAPSEASDEAFSGDQGEPIEFDHAGTEELNPEDLQDGTLEVPPPIPAPQTRSDTIETGPPEEMTLPGDEDFFPPDETEEFPQADEISELMDGARDKTRTTVDAPTTQASASEPSTQQAERGERRTQQLHPAVESAPVSPPETSNDPPAQAEQPSVESSYPAVEQPGDPEPGTDGAAFMPEKASQDGLASDSIPREAKKSGGKGLVLLILFGVFVTGALVMAYLSGALDSLLPAEPGDRVEQKLSASQDSKLDEPPPEDEAPEEPAEPELSPLEQAAQAWQSDENQTTGLAYAERLHEAAQWSEAREVIHALEPNDELRDLLTRTLEAEFSQPAVELQPELFAGVEPQAVKEDVFIPLTIDGKQARFIVDSGEAISGARASIASYRLCQAVACGFVVPSTVPAALNQEDWSEARNAMASTAGLPGADSNVRGALQFEVEGAVHYPIEETSIWRGWLAGGTIEGDLIDALSPLESANSEHYAALLAELSDSTPRDLARNTSSILTFDYLTNNFARFDSARTEFDHGVMVKDSVFLAIDNRGTFRPRTSTRVKGRFSWTSRFDPRFINSLRETDPDVLSKYLFTEPSGAEEAATRIVLSQRERILERVDSMLERSSPEDVFIE